VVRKSVFPGTISDYFNSSRIFTRGWHGLLFLVISLWVLVGCAGIEVDGLIPAGSQKNSAKDDKAEAISPNNEVEQIEIKEFFLSPGDEIKIRVYQHEDLARTIKIPPDSRIFFPIVGDMDSRGKTLRELRDIITDGLSKHKKQSLLPGDEISITVLRNEDFNRKLVVPSDGYIYFPFVGEINIDGKSPREVRTIITEGLAKYTVDPQVMVDIVKLSNPARIVDPQVSIEVIGFGGQKVYVLGEVMRPGVFFADGQMRVVEAISKAGGLTLDANQNSALLVRSGTGNPKPELTVIDVEKVFKGGDFSQNVVLQKGDIIYVSRSFIANVDRFFQHLAIIIRPLLDLEKGYWIGQNIEVGPRRGSSTAYR